VNTPASSLPPFQIVARTTGILSASEMDRLIADHKALLAESVLGHGQADASVRKSQSVFLRNEPKYRWLYQRMWQAVVECNRQFFCVDIAGIEGNIQLARYDSSDAGFYSWHTDFADVAPNRKISISIQLSESEDYDGGDLQLLFDQSPMTLERTRGAFFAFPSFALHRVTPVTRGTRWSLVAWVQGPRWR
jgi:PKHD-type hydroxylase